MNTRYEWLAKLVNDGHFTAGAEVGCKDGITTGYLLKNCLQLKLYAVDLWEFRSEVLSNEACEVLKKYDYKKIYEDFLRNTFPYYDRLTILKGVSWEEAQKVPDSSLDFVFIDADHAYESVCRDIQAWTPKLKRKGILCGHDINSYIGVQQAVEDLFVSWHDTGINEVWWCYKELLR